MPVGIGHTTPHPPVHERRVKQEDKIIEDYFKFEPVSKYRKEFSTSEIKQTWLNFWKKFPRLIWNFFIEALLVPLYRREWGKYSSWNFRYRTKPETSFEEKVKRKKINRRLKLIEHMRSMGGPGVPHNSTECDRVTINVGGTRFQTQYRTLRQFPDTLLGNPDRRIRYYDPKNKEYFFDRNATTFQAVLYYFQSGGELYRPRDVHFKAFETELRFFGLSDSTIQTLREDEGLMNDDEKPMPKHLLQRKIWLLVEYSESSKVARFVSMISIFVIILSIAVFCIETLPVFRRAEEDAVLDIGDTFFLTETLCIIWFVIEILVRFLSCPSKLRFITNGMNLIDIVAVIPYFANVITLLVEKGSAKIKLKNAMTLATLRVVRLVRVFRIFKFSRHSKGLKIIGRTLQASFKELGLLMFFLIIGIILMSSAMYFAEINRDPPNPFTSIPATFWWTVITMTTVGYGDLAPTGIWGKVVGAVCAIIAVLTIALPVPVIVSNFNYFYHRESDSMAGNAVEEVSKFVSECPFRPTCGMHRAVDPENDDEDEAFGDVVRAEGLALRQTASTVEVSRKRFMAPLTRKILRRSMFRSGPGSVPNMRQPKFKR